MLGLIRTREPDVEDTEMRGSLRKQQAEAAAINGEVILQAAGVFQVLTCLFLHKFKLTPNLGHTASGHRYGRSWSRSNPRSNANGSGNAANATKVASTSPFSRSCILSLLL